MDDDESKAITASILAIGGHCPVEIGYAYRIRNFDVLVYSQ